MVVPGFDSPGRTHTTNQKETVMPVLVQSTEYVQALRYGDVVVSIGDPKATKAVGQTVAHYPSTKIKYVTVTFASGDTVRTLLNTEVVVTRSEKTPAEREAERREGVIEALRDSLAEGVKDRAREMLDTAIAEVDKGKRSDYLTGRNLSDIVEAQAVRGVYATVQYYFDQTADLDMDEGDRLLAAFGALADREGRPRSPWNRSTSTASNVLDDTAEWAKRWVLDQAPSYLARGPVFLSMIDTALKAVQAAREAQRAAAAALDPEE